MRPPFLLLFALGFAPLASAQNVLVAMEDGAPAKMVKAVSFGRPQVEIDGKLKGSITARYALGPASLYRPGFVTFENFLVSTSHSEDLSTGGSMDYELHIHGNVKSDTALKNCFLVLELDSWRNVGCVYVEMRDLTPEDGMDLDRVFPLAEQLGEGNYRIHVFADGLEVLHSKLPARYVEEQKKKTAALLSGSKDFPPILAVSPAPVYPPELKGEKLAGSARVRCRVTKKGEVASVELVSATQPAFGTAALAATPKWKFDPAIKDRRFVESVVEIPVEFKAPR